MCIVITPLIRINNLIRFASEVTKVIVSFGNVFGAVRIVVEGTIGICV